MITNSPGRKFFHSTDPETGRLTNVACVIVSSDFRYDPFAALAEASFKAHHPDVDTYIITPETLPLFEGSCTKFYSGNSVGIGSLKYLIGRELMQKGYTKIICLGADTMVCARLTEFLEDDETHVIAGLDSNYQMMVALHHAAHMDSYMETNGKMGLMEQRISPWIKNDVSVSSEDVLSGLTLANLPEGSFKGVLSEDDEPNAYNSMHFNADVVCFNADPFEYLKGGTDWMWKKNPLFCFESTYQMAAELHGQRANIFKEQGHLNLMLFGHPEVKEAYLPFKAWGIFEQVGTESQLDEMFLDWQGEHWKIKLIDAPYNTSDVLYNIRSVAENDVETPRGEIYRRLGQFYAKDERLYNRHHKQVKVFHFRDSLCRLSVTEIGARYEEWQKSFPPDVIKFLSQKCGAETFFTTDWKETITQKTKEAMSKLARLRPGKVAVALRDETLPRFAEGTTNND